MNTVEIAERIVLTCKQKSFVLNQVLTSCGAGKNFVDNLKNGSKPNAVSLAQVAKALGVSTDYLLGETDIKNRPSELDSLSKEEFEMLELYRKANEDRKRLAKLALKSDEQL